MRKDILKTTILGLSLATALTACSQKTVPLQLGVTDSNLETEKVLSAFADVESKSNALLEESPALFRTHLGAGVSSITGEFKGNCIDTSGNTVPTEIEKVRFKNLSYTYQVIQSSEDLRKSLNISVSAKYKSMGAFSASGSYKLYNETNFNRFDLFLLVKAEVSSDYYSIKGAKITPSLIEAFKANHSLAQEMFLNQCGDTYIDSISYGGSVYAVISVSTTSEEDKRSVMASLNLKYGSAGKLDASMTSTFQSVSKNRQINVRYNQQGGTTIGVPEYSTDISGFFNYAKAVEENIKQNPAIVGFTTKPMTTLYAKLDINELLPQNKALSLASLADLKLDFLTSDAEYIVNNPKRFAKTNVEDFRDFILKKESYKSEIKDSVTACLNNYKRCDQDLFSHLTSIDDELRKTAPKLPEEFPLFDAFTIPLNFSAINGAGQGGGCGWWEMGRIDSVVPSVEESRVVYTVQLYLYDSGADCGGGSYQNPNSTIFGHVIADYEIIDGKINIKSVTTQNLTGVNSMGIGLEQVKKRVEFLNGKKVKQ